MLAQRLQNLTQHGAGINDVGSLHQHLQIALEIELSTLPPYLCALYSIPEGKNIEAAGLIRSVAMEEMLHLSLVANLLNAVGGTPVLSKPETVPQYPSTLPDSEGSFSVSLLAFSREAIATFMRIEQPAQKHAAAQADGYSTIGQFYKAISEGLEFLCRNGTIRFDHHPNRQISPSEFYNGHGSIIRVYSLETAQQAIKQICHQGEGIHHGIGEDDHPLDTVGYELAHYYRFMEIAEGRRFRPGDTPKTGPSGALLPVDWSAARPMVPNPKSGWFSPGSPRRTEMERCNQAWFSLLQALEKGFLGHSQGFQQAVQLMLEFKYRATGLMNLPSGIANTVLGPSFELL